MLVVISADNIIDNFIYTIKATSLSLAIKVGIETWVKGMLKSILNLVFTSF